MRLSLMLSVVCLLFIGCHSSGGGSNGGGSTPPTPPVVTNLTMMWSTLPDPVKVNNTWKLNLTFTNVSATTQTFTVEVRQRGTLVTTVTHTVLAGQGANFAVDMLVETVVGLIPVDVDAGGQHWDVDIIPVAMANG